MAAVNLEQWPAQGFPSHLFQIQTIITRAETMQKLLAAITLLITGCVGIPDGIKPVDHFNLENYLGKWYEIARLDHSFERGLTRVTAEYSMREDGGVRVINRGYSEKEQAWKEAEGKAYFVGSPDHGILKVSFFGPFYGSYIVFALDHAAYQYALVSGPDRSYLWLLARTPKIAADIQEALLVQAADHGFDISQLIFVEQD
jgi:apolipoprotein D and lipocalin family protein